MRRRRLLCFSSSPLLYVLFFVSALGLLVQAWAAEWNQVALRVILHLHIYSIHKTEMPERLNIS